jgi:Cu2+-exporting ATPase
VNRPVRIADGAALRTTMFAVPGLRCAGCIAKLENGLAGVDGVGHARVNFGARRVVIAHSAALDPPALREVIAGIGFDAEPLADGVVAADGAESQSLVRALAVAGFAMMNIMLLSVSVWSGAEGATRDLFHWLSALIALPAIAYAGRPFFRSAWSALRHRRTNMDVPISIGVTLAAALSLYETFTSGPHAYFDGAVMLLFFLLTGRWLDSVMRDRARDGVSQLLRQTAAGGYVVADNGTLAWHAADSIRPGMALRVAAGERFAADGVVSDGETEVDRSLLTGESAPRRAVPGDMVHAGTLNLGAPVTVRVARSGPDTALADIARLIDTAAQAKSRYVRLADRASRLYAPTVHGLALIAFAGWMLAGTGWHQSLVVAIAVLIITCPCALGLAVPAAQIVAAGALLRRGVLIKHGSALERLAEADRAVFDKTGTLTLGRPLPTNLAAVPAAHRPALLALAQSSRHPLSDAIRRALTADGVAPAPLADIVETAGEGVRASWCGRAVTLERPATANDGIAAAFVAAGHRPVIIGFEDAVRPDAPATLAALRAMGLPPLILSGDRVGPVAEIAGALGVEAVAELSPSDKLDCIRHEAIAGRRVLMVGDGLNDGPALAAGHASMAPSSASDVGQQAADAVFLGDSLAPVAIAVRAARRTMCVVRQNFALAIAYNVIAVPLAIAGQVTPLIAALAMSGSSLIVIANALRLRGVAQ